MSVLDNDRTQPAPLPRVAAIDPYRVPPLPCPVDLRLDGNEGSWPDAELAAALADLPRLLHGYPSVGELEATLAARAGVAAAQCLVTAGADEAIDRICRAFLEPGRNVVLPEPTFAMLRRYIGLTGASVNSVPWPGGDYPVDAVLRAVDAATALIAVVSPNNPTGAVASPADLERLAQAAPHALLLVDCAYAEFADQDLTATALRLRNAVVVRTLSKAWGLAGLRVGYALGPTALVAPLRAAGGPYPVASTSVRLALARLSQGSAVDAFVARVRDEVRELRAELNDLGIASVPSQANFVLARTPRAAFLRDALAGLGIAVRGFGDDPLLRDALRIACPGASAPFSRLRAALRTVAAPQALLFDLDGVLADVSQSYRAAIAATAAAFGVTLAPGEVAHKKRQGHANDDWQLTWSLLQDHGVAASLGDVTAVFERLYQGEGATPGLRARERLLVPHAQLAAWAGRWPLAIVTGRPRADAERFLVEHGVRDLFAAVVCREDAPLKPDPAPVRVALGELGVSAAWLLGDTPDDCQAARGANVLPLGVLPPGERDPDLPAALQRTGAARVLAQTLDLNALLP